MDLFYEQIANFYESRRFAAQVDRAVERPAISPYITVTGASPSDRSRLLAYFGQTSMERAGVLQGEYLLLPDLHLIVDRTGVCLKLNTAWEDYHGAYALERSYCQFDLRAVIDNLLPHWHGFPLIDRPALFSDLYMRNYFHFSLELIPRLRLIDPAAIVLIHEGMLERRFQTDLLARSLGARPAIPVRTPLRVTDPFCVYDRICADGVAHLRDASGLRAAPGERRVYLRRSRGGTRFHGGGGLAETPEIMAVLAGANVDIVEFGAGEMPVEAQVRLLDGAGLVIAPHGAALTNAAYLTAPARIIEIMGPMAARQMFMHASASLGLGHHVLFTRDYDAAGDLRISADMLAEAIATPAACRL